MAADRPQRARTGRGRFWQRHLQQWRQSGLSQAQYCRQHQLRPGTFGWWKGRLSAANGPVQPSVGHPAAAGKDRSFVELTLGQREAPAPAGEVVYEIVLSPRRCLRLGSRFEPERVRQLLQLLEGTC
jgi:hypothetical protein